MATKQAAKPEAKAPKKARGVLKKQVKLPVKGHLGRNVRTPKWLRAIGQYFAGAWQELREVRWPTRRATWGLTLAVLVFTLIMMGFILTLDFGFDTLFKRIIL